MRRITTWLLSTISALVLLFSYHTSVGAAGTTSTVASGEAAANGSSGSDPTTDGGSTASAGSATPDPTPTTDPGSSGAPPSDPTPAPTTESGAGTAPTATTVTGDAISTRYGPVQVEITVSGGTITKSVVTQVPWTDHKDQEINSYAVPILNDEAVSAQSSGIDMVSGATYTSDGYIRSLQSAIDRANL